MFESWRPFENLRVTRTHHTPRIKTHPTAKAAPLFLEGKKHTNAKTGLLFFRILPINWNTKRQVEGNTPRFLRNHPSF